MRVAILGVGRLGGSLVPLLRAAGVDVAPWSRGEPIPAADVHWITTKDDAVATVAALLPADAVVLHAAGTHGPELCGERSERGVLHPLMTFPGAAIALPDLRGVGARVDGTPGAVSFATELAERLGMRPFHVPGDPTAYHAAACLASGHLGALFLDAARVLARAGVPFEDAPALLLPLASETLRRVSASGPVALTGPAARDDRPTEERHARVLGPEERAIYAALADRIRALRTGA